jgi:hypothetical protein
MVAAGTLKPPKAVTTSGLNIRPEITWNIVRLMKPSFRETPLFLKTGAT